MKKIDIIIEGYTATSDIVGGASGSIDFSAEETGTSTAIKFDGKAKELIMNAIVKAPVPLAARPMKVLFRFNCCDGKEIPFKINPQDVSFCEKSCDLSVKFTEASTTSEKKECLKNLIIWDRENADGTITTDGEDEGKPARYIKYCLDIKPRALHVLQMYFALLIMLIIRILTPVILVLEIINLIIDLLNALIPGDGPIPNIDFDGDDSTNLFQDVNNIMQQIERWATGCGYKHKAPFMYAYLLNIAKLCNLTLKAPDFEPGGLLHNCMRLDASHVEGGTDIPSINEAYNRNRPNLNGVQYLDELENFGLDYYIDDCLLCVGPKNDLKPPTWFNAMTLSDSDIISGPCFEIGDGDNCAFMIPEYCEDAIDQSGNETRSCWVDTTIDWNDPPSASQSGACEKTMPYSAAQFRFDKCRDTPAVIDSPVSALFSFVFPGVTFCRDVLLLSVGKTSKPKILCWDGVNDIANCARVERRVGFGGLKCYNETMYISETGNNIYTNYLYQQNPRLEGVKNKPFTLELKSICDLFNTLDSSKIGSEIILPYCDEPRGGIVETISIDLSTCNLTIKGRA